MQLRKCQTAHHRGLSATDPCVILTTPDKFAIVVLCKGTIPTLAIASCNAWADRAMQSAQQAWTTHATHPPSLFACGATFAFTADEQRGRVALTEYAARM